MSDRFRDAFREEASELLGELESALLELEANPDAKELVDRVFRAMHTIKGSGAMFGFDPVSTFTHEVETVFDHVRKGEIAVTKGLIDLTLEARDLIRGMLEPEAAGDQSARDGLLARFRDVLTQAGIDSRKEGSPAPRQSETAVGQTPNAPNGLQTYRIRFTPSPETFLHGTNPVLLLGELRRMGDCRVLAHMDAVPSLQDIDPERCALYWDIILTTDRGLNAIRDVFIFVEGDSQISIDLLSAEAGTEAELKKIGEILVERGSITANDLKAALDSKKRVGEVLVERGLVTKDEVRSALAEQQVLKEVREKQRLEESSLSIRVRSDKLDKLMDLVGELVTLQARLTQTALDQKDPEMVLIAEQAERLIGDLRDTTMSLRMLPIATSFARFRRVVRDLSGEMGKEVDLVADGGETELDKTVIERLNDPLVHLIRNSVDHGIELPADREGAGKPRRGTVRLSASHSGSHVLIQVMDDGAGLDRDAIRAKGVEKGLIGAEADLPDRDIFDLIFLPGFSTSTKITSVSGRGVGMDVVKRSIESLGGTVEVNSVRGAGTSITLKIPLTLAIIEGLLVFLGGAYYVLPLKAVEECVELTRAAREESEGGGRMMANVRGQIVPYIRLREWFCVEGEAPDIEQIVITRTPDDRRIGFVVDSVIGQHQTVIKSLGKLYKGYQGISGATILGDGTVALIIDIFAVVRQAEKEKNGERA